MGSYRSNPSASQNHPRNIYVPGTIVYIFTDLEDCQNQPADCQKLWIWDYKWDPNYKHETYWRYKSYGNWFYLLKDGPGKEANDVCWMTEDKIQEWAPPKVEESLDDPPPRYDEVVKE